MGLLQLFSQACYDQLESLGGCEQHSLLCSTVTAEPTPPLQRGHDAEAVTTAEPRSPLGLELTALLLENCLVARHGWLNVPAVRLGSGSDGSPGSSGLTLPFPGVYCSVSSCVSALPWRVAIVLALAINREFWPRPASRP